MKFWRRRKPLSVPAELSKPNDPWPAPNEVIYEFWQQDSMKPGKARAVKPVWLESERIRD